MDKWRCGASTKKITQILRRRGNSGNLQAEATVKLAEEKFGCALFMSITFVLRGYITVKKWALWLGYANFQLVSNVQAQWGVPHAVRSAYKPGEASEDLTNFRPPLRGPAGGPSRAAGHPGGFFEGRWRDSKKVFRSRSFQAFRRRTSLERGFPHRPMKVRTPRDTTRLIYFDN